MDEEEWRQCHFCGTDVKDGKEANGDQHYLSDCRPDLVKHEIGPLCTWPYKREEGKEQEKHSCYAYQDSDFKWTDKHEHFYKDGPM